MDQEEQILKTRRNRIKEWFKNPHNLLFILILISGFIIRLYYLYITKNQALWWDEAEYGLRAKAFAFGTPITGWASERELIVPIIFSFFLKIGGTEIILRIIQILISTATLAFTYFFLSKTSSKNVAIIASCGMAFFWLHLFFTERILLYLWAPLLFLLISYFFYTGFIHEKKRDLYLFAVFASLGLQTYFSVGFLLLGLGIYLLVIYKLEIFKMKKTWIVLGIFILIITPYAIYSQLTYGFPIPRMATGFKAATQEQGAGFFGLFAYTNMFPSRIGWIFTILIILGLVNFIYEFFLGFGLKENIKRNENWLLIFSCFFIPLFLYTLYGVIGGSGTFYDAFILPVFPFAFAFAGRFLDITYKLLKKYNKYLSIIIILLILFFQVYNSLQNADNHIKASVQSYNSVKSAGLWVKENSNSNDVIVGRSIPQLTYYSERQTYDFSINSSLFQEFIQSKKPIFVIDSIWENTQPWIHQFLQENNKTFSPVIAYFLDDKKTQVSLIVYKVNF
jgi:hypothetical protein